MANNNQSRVARHKSVAKKPKKRHPIRRIFLWLLALFVVFLIAGAGLFTYYAMSAPKITQAQLSSQSSSVIYDSAGTKIRTLGVENRSYASGSEVPQTLKDAIISTEDRRFYSNFGIDPVRILGAAYANMTGSSGLQGGSTLTQQLVKLAVFSTKQSDQTLKRKAQEAWLAIKVDRSYSKNQILEFYINKVPLANGVYGMGTAAQYYYNKSLKQLDLAQLALIAGMPQAPNTYDPYVNPSAAKARRNIVLQSMVANKKISSQQAKTAEAVPITEGLVDQKKQTNTATDNVTDAYVSQVVAEVKKKTGLNPYTDGLKIYTNLNLKAQQRLYDIVNTDNYVSFPDNLLQTGVTMTDVKTGKVTAMIGGRKTGNVQFGLNRAVQTTRSSGSTIKPMLDYGPAIEYLNYSTYQQMQDTAYTYAGTSTQLYDWDFKYLGQISLRTALAQSRNVPAVRTLDKVGIPKATKFIKGLGVSFSKTLELQNAIGADVSSLQEAAGYAAFANGGTYYKPYLVSKIDKPDGTSETFDPQGKRAMKSSTAYMITDVLKDVISSGTGTNAQISGLHQAGKTGTTDYSSAELNNNTAISSSLSKDSWFTGYSKNYAISVWTGYDQPQQHGLTATEQQIASSIYRELMQYTNSETNASNKNWTKPSSVVAANILKGSNPAQLAASGASSSQVTRELFVRGTQPTTTASSTGSSKKTSSKSTSSVSSSSSSLASSSFSSTVSSASSSAIESSSQPTESSSSTPTEASSSSATEQSSATSATPSTGQSSTAPTSNTNS
ncbi:PBP1A family penicillin-binding protein [Loigolactobacillus binensis]|uniref:PBP1A family penicillin-binding protein n=1 Tax=Loigolactobacillus binensis TaxID=2559922 RepID=A0ABW3EA76_9LACO|nr:PBP1A family penicillin-binding protein [Loigolactobacillus binensis]